MRKGVNIHQISPSAHEYENHVAFPTSANGNHTERRGVIPDAGRGDISAGHTGSTSTDTTTCPKPGRPSTISVV